MVNKKGDSFLLRCKKNYFKDITPANPSLYNDEDYLKVVDIGLQYLNAGEIEEFSLFLQESQYFVSLWSAHIIIQFGTPNSKMEEACIQTIMEYANHPINLKIAKEEKEWLQSNNLKL